MLDQQHTRKLTLELADRSTAQIVAEAGTLIIIVAAALVGNSCVLYVFFKSSRFRTVTNYYLIALALSDVLYSMIVMPLVISVSAYGRDVLGSSVGQVGGFLAYSFVSGSLQTTTLIAVNRFFCVVKPETYRKYFKPKPAVIMIVGMWIFAVFNAGGVYFSGIANFEFYPGRFCYLLHFKDSTAEVIYSFISLFLFTILPLSITGICYWNIYKVVQEHQNAVASSLNTGPSTNSPTLSREEIRITRSVLALVCGFVICWFPSAVVLNMAVFYNLSRYAEMIFIYTSTLSTVINPIVFNIFNKPFRKEFLNIFRCGNNALCKALRRASRETVPEEMHTS